MGTISKRPMALHVLPLLTSCHYRDPGILVVQVSFQERLDRPLQICTRTERD